MSDISQRGNIWKFDTQGAWHVHSRIILKFIQTFLSVEIAIKVRTWSWNASKQPHMLWHETNRKGAMLCQGSPCSCGSLCSLLATAQLTLDTIPAAPFHFTIPWQLATPPLWWLPLARTTALSHINPTFCATAILVLKIPTPIFFQPSCLSPPSPSSRYSASPKATRPIPASKVPQTRASPAHSSSISCHPWHLTCNATPRSILRSLSTHMHVKVALSIRQHKYIYCS